MELWELMTLGGVVGATVGYLAGGSRKASELAPRLLEEARLRSTAEATLTQVPGLKQALQER